MPLDSFDVEYDYFRKFAEDNDLYAVFSMYGEGIKFDQEAPLLDESEPMLIYRGKGFEVAVEIEGYTWKDLYIAADIAIRQSGNFDRIFVEDFVLLDNGDIELITGS